MTGTLLGRFQPHMGATEGETSRACLTAFVMHPTHATALPNAPSKRTPPLHPLRVALLHHMDAGDQGDTSISTESVNRNVPYESR